MRIPFYALSQAAQTCAADAKRDKHQRLEIASHRRDRILSSPPTT